MDIIDVMYTKIYECSAVGYIDLKKESLCDVKETIIMRGGGGKCKFYERVKS